MNLNLLNSLLPKALAEIGAAVAQTGPDTLLTRGQLAEFLGVETRTLERWFLAGSGPPAIQLGDRLIRYRYGDVQKWLAARRVASTSAATVAKAKRVAR